MNEQETHEAVIRLARRELEDHERINCWFRPEFVRALIDRMESAYRREVDALKQRLAELNAEIAAKDEVILRLNDAIAEEQRRKMSTTENQSAIGDAAKLREAVIGLRDRISMFYKNEWIPYDEWEGANDDANAALAAPPRNCDKVKTSWDVLKKWHEGLDTANDIVRMLDWLFAPATETEGGNNADK